MSPGFRADEEGPFVQRSQALGGVRNAFRFLAAPDGTVAPAERMLALLPRKTIGAADETSCQRAAVWRPVSRPGRRGSVVDGALGVCASAARGSTVAPVPTYAPLTECGVSCAR
jgi:hypothetical protein